MSSEGRGERAGVTLADLMLAVSGVAVGFAVEPVRAETSRVVQVCAFIMPVSVYTSLYWTLARFALPLALALALVVLVRRARYGGLPRAAEWLALATLLLLLDPAVPGDLHVVGPVSTRPMTYHVLPGGVWVPTRHVRPAVLNDLDPDGPAVLVLLVAAGSALAAAAAAWVVLRMARRGLPSGVVVLLLMTLAWTWLRIPVRLNPTEVVRFRYSWIDFTADPAPTGLAGPALDWFVEARYALGRWPIGLFAAIPAMVVARDVARTRRRRRWTEWAGVGLALLLALAWTCDELVLRSMPPMPIRVTVFSAWVVCLTLPAWLIACRLVPPEASVWDSGPS
jgi:hypothetical protein